MITDAMRERIFGNETVMKRVEINADESVSDISAGSDYDL